MYEAFYGFNEKPFSMLPDPGFLYLSKKHQAALTLLEYGLLNHVGFCVISGEAGAGKTTILRALLDRIEDNVTVGLITNTHQSFGGLLDWVLSAFDLHRPNLTHVEMHQIFMDYLIEEYANGRTVLLIVDEAQNMKPDTLEELRMLSNVNTAKDQLMQVVLAGQPALKETLRLPDLMQFAQRIAVDYHLDALSLEETCGYIQHRLVVAGAQKDVFTPAACERIHNYSGGTPRLINLLCETVLVYGFADQQEMIDVELVDEMVLERMKDSVVPIVNRDIARQGNAETSKMLEKDFPWIRPEGGSEGLKPKASSAGDAPGKKSSAIKEVVTSDAGASKKKTAETKTVNTQAKPDAGNKVVKETKKVASAKKPVAAGQNADDIVFTGKLENKMPADSDKGETGKQVIKYGVIAVVIAAVLIAAALMLGDDDIANIGVSKKTVVNTDQPQIVQTREQERQKLKQLQLEAETLKKERDAAIAKAEEERRLTQEAEKKAAAKAAAVAKATAEKSRMEEKKRVAAAKQREREAKLAAEKAKQEALQAKREAARLEEQRRVMAIRLEEEKRLKQQEETRRLQLEWQEKQRQQMRAAEERAKREAAEEAAAKAAKKIEEKPAECSGPTARFKSGCR